MSDLSTNAVVIRYDKGLVTHASYVMVLYPVKPSRYGDFMAWVRSTIFSGVSAH